MKNIPIGIGLIFIASALFIFINEKSDTMIFVAGILLGLGIGLLYSVNKIRRK